MGTYKNSDSHGRRQAIPLLKMSSNRAVGLPLWSRSLGLFALPLLFLCSGCLEHKYAITALPDDRVEILYELKGDRADIEDGHELLPDSVVWNLKRRVEETDEETEHIYTGTVSLRSSSMIGKSLDWKRTPADSIYFSPEALLTVRRVPLGKLFRFEAEIASRRFMELYGDIWEFVPEECRALEDDDAKESLTSAELTILERKFGLGVIQWNRSRYLRAFDAVWILALTRKGALADTTVNSMQVVRTGWEADLHSYLNALDVGDPQTANLDWWNEIRPMMLGRFVDIADPMRIGELGEIADQVERRYKISKDLEDDKLIFDLTLPGKSYKSNGERDGNLIRWEIEGKEFQNETLGLTASSFLIDWLQVSLAGIAGVSILGVVFWRKRS